jgi:hypothetical protein
MSVNDRACDEQSEAQAILAFGSGSAKSVKHVWQFIGGDRGAPVMYSDADLAIFVAKLKANRRPSVTVDECVRNEVTNHLRESIGIPSAIEIAVALKFDLPFGMKGSHFVQHAARDGRKVSLPGRDGNARSEPAACEVKQMIHCLCDRAVDRIVHRSDVVEISRVATHGQDVTKEHPSQHAVLVNDLAKFKMKVESIQGMSVGLQRARPRGRRMAAGDPHPRQ